MPTPDEIDKIGTFGPIDLNGHSATVARWQSDTFEGKPLAPGRWYHVQGGDGRTTIGIIQYEGDQFYAYRPYELGETLASVFATLNEAIRSFAAKD